MRVTNQNIFDVLSAFVAENKGKTVSWAEMVGAVNRSGMKIANWMTVRNVLQYMINEKYVVRIADVTVEHYECLK